MRSLTTVFEGPSSGFPGSIAKSAGVSSGTVGGSLAIGAELDVGILSLISHTQRLASLIFQTSGSKPSR